MRFIYADTEADEKPQVVGVITRPGGRSRLQLVKVNN